MKLPPSKNRWSLKKLVYRLRKGFGQGFSSNYIPWIGIRDLSSKGTSTRMFSPKTGRKMEFLSNIERDIFLDAEFREDFLDYREQRPFDRYLTGQCATKLKYRHPIYVGTRIRTVMTADGELTIRRDGQPHRIMIDCKAASDLDTPRTQEKLAIVRMACEIEGIPHVVVTEKTVSPQRIRNILWVRSGLQKRGEKSKVPGAFDIWPMRMHKELLASCVVGDTRLDWPLGHYCKDFERRNDLPSGMGLRCAKLLMWQHLVELDMEVEAPALVALSGLTVRAMPSSPGGGQ
jgi:hypothetical protein